MLQPNHRPWVLAIALLVSLAFTGYATSIVSGALTGQHTGFSLSDALRLWNGFSLQNKTFKVVLLIVACCACIALVSLSIILYGEHRSIHGDARFATMHELHSEGLFAKSGIILAKLRSKYLVFGGQEFVMVAAPTRSGKGVSVVIPNLLNWHESLTVMDVKLENWQITSGWRQKVLGQQVYLFNPFDAQGKTHRWNPLDSVSRNPVLSVADVLQIAQIFYPSNAGDKNRFFQDTAQSLFLGLTLYLIETKHPRTTIGEVLRQGSGYGKPLIEHVKGLLAENPDLSNACKDALARVVSAPGETFGNIKATFDAALLMFSIPTLDWATSASDFDLSQLRRQKISIYLGIPVDKLRLSERLINLYFTQLINLNTRTLPEDDASLKYQCLLINDEFTAAGRLDVLLTSAAFIAGYNLRLLTIIQSTAQLKNPSLYGREGAETLLANHAVRVIFPPTTREEANEYSELLGTFTMDVTSSNRSGRGAVSLHSASYGESVSGQRRALLMPQELRKLSKKSTIVVKQGIEPAMCEKAYYYSDAIFLQRLAATSPALQKLLSKTRWPSQLQLTELRAKGEFTAQFAPTQFAPLTHRKADPQEQNGTSPLTTSAMVEQPLSTFTLEEAAWVLKDRIPEFSAVASPQDWFEIAWTEAAAVFSHLEEGAAAV